MRPPPEMSFPLACPEHFSPSPTLSCIILQEKKHSRQDLMCVHLCVCVCVLCVGVKFQFFNAYMTVCA